MTKRQYKQLIKVMGKIAKRKQLLIELKLKIDGHFDNEIQLDIERLKDIYKNNKEL